MIEGWTYAFLETAGVLPSSSATSRIACATFRLASESRSGSSVDRSASTARTLPAQVRKSFAVKAVPVISCR